ncbi:NAD-dependent epimerase/dehydratase family protein [Paenibacillus chitinolyticus]|uniref:NAD-dependent epimerase/dehydratase family protein n=1 Tax=Paenibacillus chitinolyticus TaxID=79263 RepID=UPI003559262C
MNVFVAGATGAIGRFLLPLLVKEGHTVYAMVRSEAGKEAVLAQGGVPVEADAFDREGLIAQLRRVRPEVVIHQLTALSGYNLEENARIRKQGTRNLADAAREAGVRKMIAQSISWMYEPGEGPAGEDVPLDLEAPEPRKTTVDGVAALERAAAEMPESVILRYGLLYGPGTWYARDGAVAGKARSGEVKATEGVSSLLHVEDAALAAVAALGWPSGAVNIVDDEPAPGTLWLPAYASALGAPDPEFQPGQGRGERGASNAKARREYGWEPVYPSWREGFRASLAQGN